jgi:hypothetical protein
MGPEAVARPADSGKPALAALGNATDRQKTPRHPQARHATRPFLARENEEIS